MRNAFWMFLKLLCCFLDMRFGCILLRRLRACRVRCTLSVAEHSHFCITRLVVFILLRAIPHLHMQPVVCLSTSSTTSSTLLHAPTLRRRSSTTLFPLPLTLALTPLRTALLCRSRLANLFIRGAHLERGAGFAFLLYS